MWILGLKGLSHLDVVLFSLSKSFTKIFNMHHTLHRTTLTLETTCNSHNHHRFKATTYILQSE